MRKFIILIILIQGILMYAGEQKKGDLVVCYFGSTDCTFCLKEEMVQCIKTMRSKFADIHKIDRVKFVLVCFDKDIEAGMKFVKKYGTWDEISIGSRYRNEMCLGYLNKTKIPGLPHILVFRDRYGEKSIPVLKERKIVADLVGVKQIMKWAAGSYPLQESSGIE